MEVAQLRPTNVRMTVKQLNNNAMELVLEKEVPYLAEMSVDQTATSTTVRMRPMVLNNVSPPVFHVMELVLMEEKSVVMTSVSLVT